MMTPSQLGAIIRAERKRQGLTQPELALVSGSGVRFIVEVENGKTSCHIGKVMRLLDNLGLDLQVISKRSQTVLMDEGK